MQARESLGNLSELFTDMLGDDAAAIGAHAPGATPVTGSEWTPDICYAGNAMLRRSRRIQSKDQNVGNFTAELNRPKRSTGTGTSTPYPYNEDHPDLGDF